MDPDSEYASKLSFTGFDIHALLMHVLYAGKKYVYFDKDGFVSLLDSR
eukprot:COSAG05_NODE_5769_length_1091_cov_131.266129_1_plen_48_part_00